MGFAKYNEDNARLLLERNAERDQDIHEMGWGGACFRRGGSAWGEAETGTYRLRPDDLRPRDTGRSRRNRQRRERDVVVWRDRNGRIHRWYQDADRYREEYLSSAEH